MFPEQTTVSQASNVQSPNVKLPSKGNSQTNEDPYTLLVRQFVGEVRSQLATLTGEIALRNKVIQHNDSYVYGDLLSRSLDIPIGHDFTPVNWLRRVCEIHRAQTMGQGFAVTSSYHGQNVDQGTDDQEKQQIKLQNDQKKSNAERRGELIQAIIRDNGGDQLWARMVEAASCVGTSVLKAWYSPEKGEYKMEMIEAVEHFYAVWSRSNFRSYDGVAFVYQISKQQAVQQFNVPPDVATSPLGMPLAVLSSANTVEYISTQPMVTIMEINGRWQGWRSDNGIISRCSVGDETPINAIIVGDRMKKIIDDVRYMPHFYVFPNKMIRRRPWGLPDITNAAIAINQSYIETLSDWRTSASRINFPKYKAFGFGMDTQLPKPKPRTTEMIGLGEGQDIQPIQSPGNSSSGQIDFQHQMSELKEEFIRETGISAQLFEHPDAPSNFTSNQTMLTAMTSISDQVSARRQLWEPIIVKVFEDALKTLALWDDNIKDLVSDDENWYLRVEWPPSIRKDDPAHQSMLLNRFVANTMSIQSFMERMGENGNEELDRIRDELEDPTTAAIHGKMVQLLAQYKIAGPPSAAPPKTTISLRGDLTPEQETNVSVMHGFGQGPVYGPTSGPQGQQGNRATEDQINQGYITGQGYNTGMPVIQTPNQPGAGQPGPQGQPMPSAQSPQMVNPTTNNQPGTGMASLPGSGQPTPNSTEGNNNQRAQRKGHK